MRLVTLMIAASLWVLGAVLWSPHAIAAEPTLAAVKKRGYLLCGLNGQLPGFSEVTAGGEWSGLEVDFCRALAAATLGDARKVKFVGLTTRERFDMLRAREVDVLLRNTTITLERTVRLGVRDAAMIYLDAQAVVAPTRLGLTTLAQLSGKSICTLNSTPFTRNLRDWFVWRGGSYSPVPFDDQDEMYKAFFAGKCEGLTQDRSALSTTIIAQGKPSEYIVFPENVALEPLGAFVTSGDDEWYDVVRWTLNTLFEAESLDITKANVDRERQEGSPPARRLLGLPSDDGKLLGLQGEWAYNVLKQVGNYSEIYERNLGSGSKWNFPRGVNALWDRGGTQFALPLR